MASQQEELRARTKRFEMRIVKLFRALPKFLADLEIISRSRLSSLLAEANELLAIFAASQRPARSTSKR